MAGPSLPHRLVAALRPHLAPPAPPPAVLARASTAPAEAPVGLAEPTPAEAIARVRFEDRLQRALGNAATTDAVLDVAARAAQSVDTPAPTELLLVSPTSGRLPQVMDVGPDGEGPGCPVTGAAGCEALRTGRAQVYDSADELDACPNLRDREGPPCSGACVPLVVLGEPIGVLHRTGPNGTAPSRLAVAQLGTLANQLGNRLALLRALDVPAAPTFDADTGTLDRPSVEARALELARALVPFCLAQCDLDRFRQYAAEFGHDVASRALRTVAVATQETLRPDDLVGRFGDDELLLVLPETSASEAERALDRVREHLVLSLAAAGLPPLSCSFGLVESALGRSLDDLLVAADGAVFLAKELGRNRVVVARDDLLEDHPGFA